MLSIGINAHLLSGRDGYRRAGIHHYISQILNHLPLGGDLAYTVFTQPQSGWHRPGLAQRLSKWPTEKRWLRILWEQAAWPLAAFRERLDLLHSLAFVSPALSPCPTMVTVYDLSFVTFPDRFPRLQRLYLASQTRRSCRQARRVTTISDSGRDDLHRLFAIPLEKIEVIRPGVDPLFCPQPEAIIQAFRQKQGLPDQFILHVGTLQPRKNIPTLLKALAALHRPDIPLVLVGGRGWLYEEIDATIEQLNLQRQIIFAGYVPDEELLLWYNAASLLVFPSVYEGFGMPIIQAMACGTPVIAANNSAIPEATGTAALLFEPYQVNQLADHLQTVLHNPDLSLSLRQQGFQQAGQFSWERSGRDMAESYHRALTNPHLA